MLSAFAFCILYNRKVLDIFTFHSILKITKPKILMKKIYALLTAVVLTFGAAQAQYYSVPYIGANTNPGGLNADLEYPVAGGLDASWVSIQAGTAATPAWSSTETLPFSFLFNGSAVTDFKVSTSGILTFTTSATTIPAYGALTLPNANVPDNSVCITGIRGTGTNDNIVMKTFGTSPNQQLWIMFSSYSTATANVYTYWSIVLEEGSNNIYIVDQRHNTTVTVSAGVQINATTATKATAANTITSQAAADPSSADNTYYQFIQGTQAANAAKLKAVAADQYIVVPGSSTVTGTIQNVGASAITTADIKYEVGGNTYSQTLSGLNVASGATYNFTHNTPINVASPMMYPVKVWVELANDADHTDDTLSTFVSGLTFLPTKRVLVEEATGTWCGWCPRGAVYTEQIDTVHLDQAIVVAVHNGDPMTNAIYDAGMGSLISGYPSGLVDRKSNDVDPSNFETAYSERILDVSPADVGVSATFNSTTRQVDVAVSATFAADLTGDYRLNCILVEDDVTGTGSTYNQTNYYSSASQNIALVGAGHNWQTEPASVPAASMHYNFVGRDILGGFDGEVGSIPSTITANSTYTYNFSTTIPTTWDASQMRVIGVLHNATTGNVLNVFRGSYGIATSVQQIEADNFSMSLYPNPAAAASQLEINLKRAGNYTVDMFDILGQNVMSRNFNGAAGKNNITLNVSDLHAGMYLVRVNVGGSVLTSRLMVK